MNIIGFFIALLNNSKKNSFNLNKKDKISNLKINIIMDNTVKIRKNNNSNFLNNKNNLKHENKREKRFYDKEDDNGSEKIQVAKLNKYYEKKEKFEP